MLGFLNGLRESEYPFEMLRLSHAYFNFPGVFSSCKIYATDVSYLTRKLKVVFVYCTAKKGKEQSKVPEGKDAFQAIDENDDFFKRTLKSLGYIFSDEVKFYNSGRYLFPSSLLSIDISQCKLVIGLDSVA